MARSNIDLGTRPSRLAMSLIAFFHLGFDVNSQADLFRFIRGPTNSFLFGHLSSPKEKQSLRYQYWLDLFYYGVIRCQWFFGHMEDFVLISKNRTVFRLSFWFFQSN